MKKIYFSICTVALALVSSAQFTAGNIAVLQADVASSNNTTCTIVELGINATQTVPVSSYSINGTTDPNAFRISGSATSTGYLANSNNGTLLSFTGGNTSTTSSNINTIGTRAVATLNPAGNFAIATTYTGTSGQQTRCATSLDNNNWFIADQAGIYTNAASTASPTGNYRSIKSYGGVVYVCMNSSLTTVIQVNTVSAATSGTVTGLSGLTNSSTIQDFAMAASGSNGAAFDLLYIINNTGTIDKYSLVAGTWVSNGSYTTGYTSGFGLAAKKTTTGVQLFFTTGTGATAGNSVVKIIDNAGFNTSIAVNASNTVVLYTAPSTSTIKGVAFAPAAVTTPVSFVHVAAQANAGYNHITWQTANEMGCKEYRLQKSIDGILFSTIQTIAANNNASNSYLAKDWSNNSQTVFYRVEAVDLDGKTQWSKMVAVQAKQNLLAIQVSPNPVKYLLTINNQSSEQVAVKLLNTNGVVVFSQSFTRGQHQFSMANLPAGTYMLQAQQNQIQQTYKLIKE